VADISIRHRVNWHRPNLRQMNCDWPCAQRRTKASLSAADPIRQVDYGLDARNRSRLELLREVEGKEAIDQVR